MSGVSLQIDLNAEALQQAAQQLLNVDPRSMLAEIGEYQLTETLLNFDAEQTPEGDDWVQSQRAAESGGKTLQDQGHLRDSYNYQVEGDRVEIGSNMVYAAIHHFGGEAGRNHSIELPARVAMGITATDEQEIRNIGTSYLQRVLGGAQ